MGEQDGGEEERGTYPCMCFTDEYEDGDVANRVKNTCRNHHWGLLHLCQPTDISVTWVIERVDLRTMEKHLSKRKSDHLYNASLWYKINMRFTAQKGDNVESVAGWYYADLTLQEGEYYGYKTPLDGLVCILSIGGLIWFFLLDFVWSLALLPINLKSLLELRKTSESHATEAETRKQFSECMRNIMDARGHRSVYLGLSEISLEWITSIILVFAFIGSMHDWHGECHDELNKGADVCQGLGSRVPAYLRQDLFGWRLFVELLYEYFFDDLRYHVFAWFLIYMRAICYFMTYFEDLRWLPTTFMLAGIRLAYFFVALAALVIGFSVVIWLQFGARYVQFNTMKRAVFGCMLLFTGIEANTFEDVWVWHDNNSFLLSAYMMAFMTCSQLVLANFFITIVMDAYTTAFNPDTVDDMYMKTKFDIDTSLMRWLGILKSPDVSDVRSQTSSQEARGDGAAVLVEMSELPSQEALLHSKSPSKSGRSMFT